MLNEINAREYPGEYGAVDTLYWTNDLAKSADAWYLRSFTALELPKALAWAKQALRREPDHELALSKVALLSEAAGDFETALSAASRLADTTPAAARWIRFRINILLELDRYEEAHAQCRSWVEKNPDEYYTHFMQAKVERRMGRYEDAERSFTRALDARSDSEGAAPWLYFHRGTMRCLIDEKEGAISDYREAYKALAHPNFGNARLCILLHEVGRPDEAEASLAEVRRDETADPWLRTVFDCLAGEIAPAELAAIAERDGGSVRLCEAYYYAGEAALLTGFVDEAKMWFEKCVENGLPVHSVDPTESFSEFELAHWRLGKMINQAEALQTKGP
jgi:tetratricopeptide (TPR) repeat protein